MSKQPTSKQGVNPTCATCPYFNNGGATMIDKALLGECRIDAPRVIGIPAEGVSYMLAAQDVTAWPVTASTDWCGRHPDRERVGYTGKVTS